MGDETDVENHCWNKIANPETEGTMVSIVRDSSSGQFKMVLGGQLARSVPQLQLDPATHPTLYACVKFGGGTEKFGMGEHWIGKPTLGIGDGTLYYTAAGRQGVKNLQDVDTSRETP